MHFQAPVFCTGAYIIEFNVDYDVFKPFKKFW